MATIELTRTELVVRMHGWNIMRTMRRTLRVPLAHVRQVRAHPPEARFDDVLIETWRGIGVYVPGKHAAGLVYLSEGAAFYEVRDAARAIAVDLDRERVCCLVFQVDDEAPEVAARSIAHAVERYYGRDLS
jgi:hypothetical protein